MAYALSTNGNALVTTLTTPLGETYLPVPPHVWVLSRAGGNMSAHFPVTLGRTETLNLRKLTDEYQRLTQLTATPACLPRGRTPVRMASCSAKTACID